MLASLVLFAAGGVQGQSAQWVSTERVEELREALAPHGWLVMREADGGLLVYRQGIADVPEPDTQASATTGSGPAGQAGSEPQEKVSLVETLRAAGWLASGDSDGGLLLIPLEEEAAAVADPQVVDQEATTEAMVPAESPGGDPMPAAAPPALPDVEHVRLLHEIEQLRAAGWQVSEDGEGGLLARPPVGQSPAAVPPIPDQDGDGVADVRDLCDATSGGVAVNALGCPVGLAVLLQGVHFRSGAASLTQKARETLAGMAEVLRRHPQQQVTVLGHTDSQGAADANQRLSQRRADAVRSFLVVQGLVAGHVKAEGRGETQPVADNATVEGRRLNRRVELVIHELD